jgi:predicted ATPase
MLNHLKVKGFKSIKELDLELRPLNVLIGANGSGKSNFISLFQLINKIAEKNLQLFVGESGGADLILYYGQKVTRELSVSLFFDLNSYEFTLVPSATNTLIFSDETCTFWGPGHPQPYVEPLGAGHTETNLHKEIEIKKKPGKIGQHVLSGIQSWKIYHFHDTGSSSGVKQFCNINDNFALRPDASNLAAFLFFLRANHSQYYRDIVETIRLAAPFFNDFILRPHPYNNQLIQLEWSEVGTDAYFNAHSFSDGTLRFICLATLLLQPVLPSTILLDEPELGLHPYAITLLAALLRSAATKTQVIVATQSVTLVNQLVPEDIIVVDRHKKQSIFRHLDKEDMTGWLDEYGLGDLWEKNIFGGRP